MNKMKAEDSIKNKTSQNKQKSVKYCILYRGLYDKNIAS